MTGDSPNGEHGDGEAAVPLSARAENTPPSGIRRFFELAEEREDVISLGVGEPDFSVPWAARQAAIDSLERGRTSYTSNRGLRELRAAIADHQTRWGHDYDPADEVLVTTGVSEGVDLAMRALVDPGDTVAIAEPAYISYGPNTLFSGGDPLPVPTRPEDGFMLTYDVLDEAGAADADVLILCYPNNPTGAIMREDDLQEVAAFAIEHDLAVLSDEVYAALTYDGGHDSIATIDGMRERTVVFNGFSKAYAMTGLRLGYAMGPTDLVDGMNRIHQYTMLSAPTTPQHAALEALRSCESDVEDMVGEYNRRRRFVLSRLDEMGLDCYPAQGAFYVFPEVPGDDEDFAEGLLNEEGVAVVPGNVFGDGGVGHVRMSYARSMSELRQAMDRMESYVRSL